MGFGDNPFSREIRALFGLPGGSRTAGSGIHFTLRGDTELLATLRAMTTDKQFFLAQKKALDAGGGVMKRAIIANLGGVKDTGLLARSIKARLAPPKYRHSMLEVVGPTHMKRMVRRTKGGSLRMVSDKKIGAWEAKGARLISYDPGNYGHLVERGAKGHWIGRKNKRALMIYGGHPMRGPIWHPGFEGIGFMRKAVDAQGRAAVAKVNAKLLEEINKLARKHRKLVV